VTTKVEKSVLVNVPVSTAYNQWTQFEDFPQFMGGVKKVTQLSDDRLEWTAEIAGVRRQWTAKILEQVPDQKVAWAATEGATNAGAVTFQDLGGGQTSVQLSLEYEPEGLLEAVGDKLNVVENQAEKDLERFKAFIEAEGYASGAWRGTVNEGSQAGTPDVDDAAGSRGDKGKAGVSGAAVAAGVGVAAAAAGAVAAGAAKKPFERRMATARDIMTGSAECVSVNDTLTDAARKLRDLDIGAMPICGEDNRLKGMLTDRDIVIKCIAEGRDPAATKVSQLAEGKPVTIGADDSVEEALRTMKAHGVRRLPVIDGHDLIGIVSQADIARNLPDDKISDLVEAISSAPPNS
jgi:CBS domain-containing protein/ribosome-associated toxin RatA of RatAB toxin-antitoxin module